MLAAVEAVNERQKQVLVDRVVERFGDDLHGRTFALWGLAFKPETDDMREATSRVVITGLLQRGARVRAYDPVAGNDARRVFGPTADRLAIVDSAADALAGADALLIVTEWKEFKSPDFDQIKSLLAQPVVFDGRNLYAPALMRALGIEYRGVGRAAVAPPPDSVDPTSLANPQDRSIGGMSW